jgi:hypothetical protein
MTGKYSEAPLPPIHNSELIKVLAKYSKVLAQYVKRPSPDF